MAEAQSLVESLLVSGFALLEVLSNLAVIVFLIVLPLKPACSSFSPFPAAIYAETAHGVR